MTKTYYITTELKKRIIINIKLIFILILSLSLITAIKFFYLKSIKNTLTNPKIENLGTVTTEKKESFKLSINTEYPKGDLIGNSQSNIEQNNNSTSLLNGSNGQLSYSGNIVFKTLKNGSKYDLKIYDELDNSVKFQTTLENKPKKLISLNEFYMFVTESEKGDKVYFIDDKYKNITEINNSVLNNSKIQSLITDGHNLYFIIGLNLYKSDLLMQDVETLSLVSKNDRIVNLKNNKLFIDDTHTLYSIDLITKEKENSIFHSFSNQVIFDNNYPYIINVLMSEVSRLVGGKEEKMKNFSAYNLAYDKIQDKMYYFNSNKLIDTNNKLIFESNINIASVYITNNFIYIYDINGAEYQIKK